MTQNEYEKKLLAEIKRIDDGIVLGLWKLLKRSKFKKLLKKIDKDPEVKAAMAAYNYHSEELEKMIKDYEKKTGKKYKRLS